jgi:alkanesulfonate monooxygenase SsuD/methylene tetrahydromethanopterin reductase-like flavin-dependent oxidoreductase (luciferase family)
MYCAWGSPQTIPIAAETGLRALFIPQTTWVEYAKQIQQFTRLRDEHGFPPAPPTVVCWVYCAETEEAAWDGARQYIPAYADSAARHYELLSDHFGTTKGYEHYAAMSNVMNKADRPHDMAEMYLTNQVWGTPEQCIDKIQQISQLMGPDHFVAVMKYGGMPLDLAEASMRLFAREVLPVVQAWPVAPLQPTA